MLVQSIINKDFSPLSPSDKVSRAIAKMDGWQVTSLPVVEPRTEKLIGQITLEQLADIEDESMPVSRLDLQSPVFAYPHQHVFEVTRQMLMQEVRMIAVVDADHTFCGIAEKKKLLELFTDLLNITAPGSVISVEVESNEYTLTELVHLIEAEEARILGVTVEAPSDASRNFQLSFKLNLNDTSGVSQSLRRHGYTVQAESHSELLQVDIEDRADELMRYLDV